MKVAFFAPNLNERGTSVAQYDYAHFNETLLGNESIFITTEPEDSPALKPFVQRFGIFRYQTMAEVDAFIREEGIAVCYMIAHGRRDYSPERLPSACKMVVHCVFRATTPFGDVYACISDQVNQRSGSACPVVPHIIHLPDTDKHLRQALNLPEDAVVFGRYGGSDTFNIPFVHRVIEQVIQERCDRYFLFMNTDPFLQARLSHPQVIHLPASYDLEYKTAFINTCDAMLHARKGGETFGMAVGEFSIRNKPVMTWRLPRGLSYVGYCLKHTLIKPWIPKAQRLPKRMDDAHLAFLGDKALTYCNARQLYRLLMDFDPLKMRTQDWDAYSERFSPKAVMALFEEHFLKDI